MLMVEPNNGQENLSCCVTKVIDMESSDDESKEPIRLMAALANQVGTKIRPPSNTNIDNDVNENQQRDHASIIRGMTSSSSEKDEQSSIQHYHRVENWCRHHISSRRDNDFLFDPQLWYTTMKHASRELNFPPESLRSFFHNLHLKHIKSASYKVHNQGRMYLNQYRTGTSILQLAKNANFPPQLMARLVVENVAGTHGRNMKLFVKNAMRDPLKHLGSIECIRDNFKHTEEQWALQQQQQLG
jgi:hypothetical protein